MIILSKLKIMSQQTSSTKRYIRIIFLKIMYLYFLTVKMKYIIKSILFCIFNLIFKLNLDISRLFYQIGINRLNINHFLILIKLLLIASSFYFFLFFFKGQIFIGVKAKFLTILQSIIIITNIMLLYYTIYNNTKYNTIQKHYGITNLMPNESNSLIIFKLKSPIS